MVTVIMTVLLMAEALVGLIVISVAQVDRLVIDPRTRQIVQLVAKQGRVRRRDYIIDRAMVNHVDVDVRVHLSITEEEVEGLREFVTIDYAPPNNSMDDPSLPGSQSDRDD